MEEQKDPQDETADESKWSQVNVKKSTRARFRDFCAVRFFRQGDIASHALDDFMNRTEQQENEHGQS